MLNLTFGEQVKIILSRKGMTIKELAETIEEKTGKKMSRQNLTQRLGRDNFQEQDMRMIAEILECPFHLSIMEEENSAIETQEAAPTEREILKLEQARIRKDQKKKEREDVKKAAEEPSAAEKLSAVKEPSAAEESSVAEEPSAAAGMERDITIGELVDIHKELDELAGAAPEAQQKPEEQANGERRRAVEAQPEEKKSKGLLGYFQRRKHKENAPQETAGEEPEGWEYGQTQAFVQESMGVEDDEDLEIGDINPQTGHEYETNTVRVHPRRIGYVQVYDRGDHRWTDMTEWAFLGYQERKKALLGDDYDPPIYLD